MFNRKPFVRVGIYALCTAVFSTSLTATAQAAPRQLDNENDQAVSITAPDHRNANAESSLRTQSSANTQSSATTTDPAGYWTEEKMRSAIPADRFSSANAALAPQSSVPLRAPASDDLQASGNNKEEHYSHPVSPSNSSSTEMNSARASSAPVPSTAGKVFFTYKGKDYACSGSVINTANKSVVSTAGHCVHGGKGKGWHSNIAFAPAYRNGKAPRGLWNWKRATTFKGWRQHSDPSRDQAFFTVHKLRGKTLVQAVGGNGISYNLGHRRNGVRIWGWPGEKPFYGERAHYCDGNTFKRHRLLNDMRMSSCAMSGGASGGPWLSKRTSKDLGYVFGVTSRASISGPRYVLSTPFNNSVRNLLNDIGK